MADQWISKGEKGLSAMKKRVAALLALLIILIIIAICFFLFSHRNSTPSNQQLAPKVLAVNLKQIQWQPTLNTVGSFSAVQGITITAQVTARVKAILFKSGERVKKGQVLVTLEDADLVAQLQQKTAQLNLGKMNYDRYQKLFSKKFASGAQIDEVKSKFKEAQADVNEIKAQLQYYVIKAPFSGVIGLRNISIGELIQPGNLITHLQQFDPIYLNFALPQKYISQSLVGKPINANISVAGKKQLVSGKIMSIDSQLDKDTRTIQARAVFQNKNNTIIPGMFSQINVPLGKQTKVLVAPSSAVVHTLYGSFIFTAQASKKGLYKVTQVAVNAEQVIGKQVILNSAHLKAGELVVSMGGFKLRNNEMVRLSVNKKGA